MRVLKALLIFLFLLVGAGFTWYVFVYNADVSPIEELSTGVIQPCDTQDTAPAIPEPADPPPVIPTPSLVPVFNYLEMGGIFELPVNGATGWAAVASTLRAEPYSGAASVASIGAGQGFTILVEQGDWWQVERPDGLIGWIEHRRCFINLPDVVPSIPFNITNAHGSILRSAGYEIPNVTGEILYHADSFNLRLDRYEFIVPIMYAMSKKVSAAQQMALADGNTLVVYEAFRPRDAQRRIVSNLSDLAEANPAVNAALNTPPWTFGWFIGTGLSNHQRGAAIDKSLARVISTETLISGDFEHIRVVNFLEYTMPTPIHDLSHRAATFARPVGTNDREAWRGVPFAPGFTAGAELLLHYADLAGLTPLASEWWHFDHPESRLNSIDLGVTGEFFIETIYSVPPVR